MRNVNVKIIKKNGGYEDFDANKIIVAVSKSADRAMVTLTDDDKKNIVNHVINSLETLGIGETKVSTIHKLVEQALDDVSPRVAESYRSYRDYKNDYADMMNKAFDETDTILLRGDNALDSDKVDAARKENGNKDASLVATQQSLARSAFTKYYYEKTFLTQAERQAHDAGFIYIHDAADRIFSANCCLFNASTVLEGGFEMGNMWYNEPKSLDVAFDVLGDIILSAASQQYGGFTIPRVDTLLVPYAEKTYTNNKKRYKENGISEDVAEKMAKEDVAREFEQGFQGWEYKFNTVGSSRGDYPFITVTTGLDGSEFGIMANKIIFKNHMNGQGKKGHKKPVLFPKYVFLYDENLHGPGKPLEEIYNAALECSSKTMYPDWLSLTGEGYVPSMYKKYGKVISPMGCRAFLSPWYERGGMYPADDEDVPVYEGRFNCGAISLNLPLIYLKSQVENKDFYEVLDSYLEMIREIHKRTYNFLGNKMASINPLGFCEGGFYGGTLKPDQKLKESPVILQSSTFSFGITALNELQEAYNQTSLVEDGQFALEVLTYINNKIVEFKDEDDMLYAIYGTPAEGLCLAGDTEVQCYNGNKVIKDIRKGDLVYSFNEKRQCIELKPVIQQCLTQKKAKVVKVTFDDGTSITCTPNHPFAVRKMTRDNTGRFVEKEHIEYVEAQNLQIGARVKSNYFMYDPYQPERKMCSIYHNGRQQLVQDINAEYVLGEKPKGYVLHHKDGNKENNSFENLEYLSDAEHRRLHLPETIQKYQYTSENSIGEKNPFYGKHHSPETISKLRQDRLHNPVLRISKTGEIIKRYEGITDVQKDGLTEHLASLACRGQRTTSLGTHYYKDSLWFYEKDYIDNTDKNHKVVSVEPMEERIDVYDITVADNHNFFVGGDSGVLVHNCGKQIRQLRKYVQNNADALIQTNYDVTYDSDKKVWVIPNVCDRDYVSNSFHCGVWEDISPVQKQDLENRFWNLSNGGKIQYCRYPVGYNKQAIKTIMNRAMDMGFYEGVNLALNYCDDCGHEEVDMADTCPVCGSKNITKIDRMNGYLAFSRVKGNTRLNQAKMAEIKDRKSM